MNKTPSIESLPGILVQEPLSRYTTFRVGGPAKWLFTASTTEEIIQAVELAKQNQLPYFVLGNGSNLVFADTGFDGLVIKINTRTIERDNLAVNADAGVAVGRLAIWAASEDLAGLEFASGIPGSVGGAIRGNAGCFGSDFQSLVIEVTALTSDGHIQVWSNNDCKFAYRESAFKHNDQIILRARLGLAPGNRQSSETSMTEKTKWRMAHQEYALPSAGSMFKNPPEKSAGQLIEDVGFKGRVIGHVMASTKHANFIVNTGGATATEVFEYVQTVKQAVKDRFGIELVTEVQFVGF
jgi:UDP-N-acetylmuramate dehydrogenase